MDGLIQALGSGSPRVLAPSFRGPVGAPLAGPVEGARAPAGSRPQGVLTALRALIGRLLGSTSQPPTPPGAVRVAPVLSYAEEPGAWQWLRDTAEATRQSRRADLAPGTLLARHSDGGKKGIRQLREAHPVEPRIPVAGLHRTKDGWRAPTLRNPDSPDGRFDAFAWMPRLVFDPREDAYPVRPDLDDDGQTRTDADHYAHGVVGGNQALTGACTVTRKGAYTVMTYSLYFVDNKFTNYHRTDSATMSVYLEPGVDGRLRPAFLYTSWHYGGRLTPWDALQKDEGGRPIVRVERGSHALHPYGHAERVPPEGLHVRGDGLALLSGRALPERMTWLSPQASIARTRTLDPAHPVDAATLDAYFAHYPERRHPIDPLLWA